MTSLSAATGMRSDRLLKGGLTLASRSVSLDVLTMLPG